MESPVELHLATGDGEHVAEGARIAVMRESITAIREDVGVVKRPDGKFSSTVVLAPGAGTYWVYETYDEIMEAL